MAICATIIQFAESKEGYALFWSVIGGAVFTGILANASHSLLQWYYPELSSKDRGPIIAALTGALERLLLTILTLWVPAGPRADRCGNNGR